MAKVRPTLMDWSLWAVILLTIAVTALRFVALERSPPGFYVDEAAVSAQVICLRESGHDNSGFMGKARYGVVRGAVLCPFALGISVFPHRLGPSVISFGVLLSFLLKGSGGRVEACWVAFSCRWLAILTRQLDSRRLWFFLSPQVFVS
jgi:hypothetical protein